MNRVVLVQARPGNAQERAEALRRAGFVVDVYVASEDAGTGLLKWLTVVPDAFLIDLERSPSVGRAKGMWLRNRRDTRRIPLVFAGGDPAKIDEVRGYLPDAMFTSWDQAAAQLRQAIATPLRDPVVPDPMAPYKGASLAKKLGVRTGTTVRLIGAPAGFEGTLGPLPPGATVTRSGRGRADLALLFIGSMAELRKKFAAAGEVTAGRPVWLVWPKQASGQKNDVTQASARKYAMASGWVDYKVASIDDTWTGLAVTRRAAPKASPASGGAG